jgi:peroxiredoxin
MTDANCTPGKGPAASSHTNMTSHHIGEVCTFVQSARDKDDHEVALSKYANKVTVVVNVASQCGYTQQNYKGLVELYKEFKDKGFEVVRLHADSVHQSQLMTNGQASLTMERLCSAAGLSLQRFWQAGARQLQRGPALC